jgi:hypothetical protein
MDAKNICWNCDAGLNPRGNAGVNRELERQVWFISLLITKSDIRQKESELRGHTRQITRLKYCIQENTVLNNGAEIANFKNLCPMHTDKINLYYMKII